MDDKQNPKSVDPMAPGKPFDGTPTAVDDKDRNGDPMVTAVLNIIDKEHSRYKVAVATAEFINRLLADELTAIPSNPNFISEYIEDRLANLGGRDE